MEGLEKRKLNALLKTLLEGFWNLRSGTDFIGRAKVAFVLRLDESLESDRPLRFKGSYPKIARYPDLMAERILGARTIHRENNRCAPNRERLDGYLSTQRSISFFFVENGLPPFFIKITLATRGKSRSLGCTQ